MLPRFIILLAAKPVPVAQINISKDNMRVIAEDGLKIFTSYDRELTFLSKEIDPLKEVTATSSQVLQVISFHLVFEYLIEQWIDHKINKGISVFKGIEKIGFHNKLYIAKNIGMPKALFLLMDKINDERNKFAHQISKKEINKNNILGIGKLSDDVDCVGARFEELGIPAVEGGLVYSSTTKCEKTLLHIVLQASLGKLRNYTFVDIHHSTSSELPPKKLFNADAGRPAQP